MGRRPSLAEYIYGDVASTLVKTGEPPCKLTLSAIAAHYNVSLSPVRTAVDQLVQEGFLTSLENGRIAVSSSRKQWKSPRTDQPAPPADYEKIIQSDLIRMSLLGEDGFLREQYATDRYGLGRTALRPILSKLAGQGLIERVPRRGWRIRPFDKDDLCSFIEIRELLELKALRLARPKLEEEKLRHLLQLNQSPDSRERYALDNGLHYYWISNCGNRYIRRFFDREAVYFQTLFDYAAPEAQVAKEMAQQHCHILEALIAKRWREAADALSEHIRAQKPITQALIAKLNDSNGADDLPSKLVGASTAG